MAQLNKMQNVREEFKTMFAQLNLNLLWKLSDRLNFATPAETSVFMI